MDFFLLCGVAMMVSVFIGTAVYFIMSYGTKEKTYEEAILEQRQRSEDAFFLGKSAKEKQKEKKLKKAGKKVKEKSEKAAALKDSTSGDEYEQTSHSHKNQHVAFVAEAAIIDGPLPTQKDETADQGTKKAHQKPVEAEKSKAPKKDAAAPKPEKPQGQPQVAVKTEKQPAPKAEKASSSVKAEKTETKPAVKEVAEKQEKAPAVLAQPTRAEKEEKKTPVQEAFVAVVANTVAAPAPSKSSKKKKGEPSLEQMTSGRDGINANLLEPLIHKAELSRSEIQNLIDLLLNKQQGSETEVAEWNEGRQDPMMKLKKAYAEKEKALQEEQEASLALQNKLREVRSESNAERSRLTALNKQMEEKLLSRTNEIAAATAKFHHEKHTLTQQLQQLKHQLDQEHQLIRKYQEELGQAQNAMQTQQTLEHHIANQNAQLQGQDQQIAVLQQQVAENQAAVQQCDLLSAQVAQLQEQLKNAQNSNQGEVHSKQKQLNDMKAAKDEAERQLNVARQREGQLNSELSKLKDVVNQRQADLEKMAAEAAEVTKLREENELLTSQVSLVSQLQKEARQLREENESLAAQVTAVTERPAAEGRENGDLAEEKHADGKLASAQLINDLRERDLQVEELQEKVKQAEKSATTTIDTLKSEITAHKNEVLNLTKELDQQRKKNDELRNKNYKAMEALAASEKMFQTKISETEKLIHEAERNKKLEEEKKIREALQRLFPSITVEEKVHDQWVKKFYAAVSKHVSELSSKTSLNHVSEDDHSTVVAELEKRNSQLSGMVTNYKRIIEDTEGMLNKLQQHVEAEETKWQQQLAEKEAELVAIKEQKAPSLTSEDRGNGVQTQLGELQKKLQTVDAERSVLKMQLSEQMDLSATIEALKVERNNLSEELKKEQEKALDQSKQLVNVISLLDETKIAMSKEKEAAQHLRDEIEKLKENNVAPPASPVPSVHNGSTNGPSAEPTSAEVGSKRRS